MSLSMHEIVVPPVTIQLDALSGILDLVAAHAEARNLDLAPFLNARLSPDMFPFTEQIGQATMHVQRCIAKLADIDEMEFGEPEDTLDYWKDRIAKTREFVANAPADKMEGSEDREVELATRVRTLNFTGRQYVLHFVFPQFFFHVTTAHDIARSVGVEIGKRHYLGDMPQSK